MSRTLPPVHILIALVVALVLLSVEPTRSLFVVPILLILVAVPLILQTIPGFSRIPQYNLISLIWVSGALSLWFVNELFEGRRHPILGGEIGLIILFGSLAPLFFTQVWRTLKQIWIFIPMGCTWMMCYFSAGSGGSGRMRGFFEALFHSPTFADAMVIVIRKSIHVTFYSLVAVTMLMAVRTMGESVKRARWTALALTLVIGSTDEFRQSLVPGRTGQWQDVLLDMSGAFVFTWILARWLSGRKESPATIETV